MIKPTLNIGARGNYIFLKESLFKEKKSPKILCVGAGEGEGEGIGILKPYLTNIDIKQGKDIDIVCNAEKLPFKDNTFDAVIFQAVLEHIKNYREAIKEAHRILRDGGYIYVEMPFLQGRHSAGDYRRFTLDGLKLELSAFKEIRAGISVGPFSSFVWVTYMLLALIFSLGNKWLFDKLKLLFLYLLFPLKYLDIFFSNSKNAEIIASAFYFLGKK